MRAGSTFFATVILFASVACSTKTSSNTTVGADKPSPFRLDNSETDRLREVGCHVDGTNLRCDEITTDTSVMDRVTALNSAQRKIEKRHRAFADVQASLRSNRDIGATLFSASLSGLDAELLVQGVHKDLEINQEELFLNVLGYKCEGSGLSETIVKSVDFKKDLGKATLKFDSKQHFINWHVGEQLSATDLNVYYVQTDGEFSLVRHASTPSQMNCFRQRATGVATALTDRPLERHALSCESYFLRPGVTAGSKVNGYSLQFESHAGDKKETVFLEGQDLTHDPKDTDDPVNSMSVWSELYLSRLESVDGVLKFIVYNQKTDDRLLEITTSNSTLNFSYGFRDANGNGVAVDCKTK